MDEHDLVDGFCEWVKQDEARDIDSPELRDELARLFECVRTETEARVVEAAANECYGKAMVCGQDWVDARNRIRALAPGDYVAVRREDFDLLTEAVEELEARIRMERVGYESSRADEIRAALSRARKGE